MPGPIEAVISCRLTPDPGELSRQQCLAGFGQYEVVTNLSIGSYKITKWAWHYARRLLGPRAVGLAGPSAARQPPPPGTQFHTCPWRHPSVETASHPVGLRSCVTDLGPGSHRPIRGRPHVSPGESVTLVAAP